MLSRTADALYWMARYLERVEHTARLIEVDLCPPPDAVEPASGEARWRPLLGINGNAATYAALHPDGLVTQERVIRFLTVERANANAVRACLRLARDNGRVVRDRLSPEAWEILNALWLRAAPHLERADGPEAMIRFCRALRGEVAQFHGVTLGTMVRDEAFAFYQLGTFVERADMTARILDARAGATRDEDRAAVLLHALGWAGALQETDVQTATIVARVVREAAFPRSLRFAVDRIAQALADVDAAGVASSARRVVAGLQVELVERDPAALAAGGLHDFLVRFVAGIAGADAALRAELFHTATEASCAT